MMNIKIIDPIPETEVIVTLPFGSYLYGTATKKSDKDFVKILKQNSGDLVLQHTKILTQHLVSEGHGWKEFWEDTEDYIYVDRSAFFKKIRSGSSTCFFECLHTKEFKEYFFDEEITQEIFNNYLLGFYTKPVAKAYLGLAKRDLHYPERMHHVIRCIWTAKKIMNKELIDLSEIKNLPKSMDMTKEQLLEYIKELRDSLKIPSIPLEG